VPDEPTPGEVDRAFQRFRLDTRDDLRAIHDLLGLVVRLDVYGSDQRAVDERLRAIREDLARIDTDHQAERKEAQEWRDRRDAARKWLIAGVLLPIGGLLIEIIFAVRGGK
jgi:hypothetical protein